MSAPRSFRHLLVLGYALASYASFVATISYACGFIGGFWGVLGLREPFFRSLDTGRAADNPASAWLIDALLLVVFAAQHSVMARRGFKAWWTRIVPAVAERSTYVLASSLALSLLFWQWRPLGTQLIWNVSTAPWPALLVALSLLGWVTALSATFMIDHFELFGLKQVWRAFRDTPAPASAFTTPALYRVVRHPLYLGFIVAFWATPTMTLGHLTFTLATTLYILGAIQLEERDLRHTFGESYRAYQQRVRMLLPLPRRARAAQSSQQATSEGK